MKGKLGKLAGIVNHNLGHFSGAKQDRMPTMRNRYSETFKAQVVLGLLKEEKTVAQIASEYQVHPTQLNEWKATALKRLPNLFSRDRQAETALKAVYDKRIEELSAEIGRMTTQVNWLKNESGIAPDAH